MLDHKKFINLIRIQMSTLKNLAFFDFGVQLGKAVLKKTSMVLLENGIRRHLWIKVTSLENKL